MIVDKIKKRESKSNINKKSNIDIPIGKWIKCDKCKEIIYKEKLRENSNICPNCGHYFRMHIGKRIQQIIDEDTYKRFELNIDTINPLGLEDYPKKLKMLREKTDLEEDGIFSGMMLPYFTVDGQYYFCKAELDNWVKEVANEHTEYNTAEGWRKQKITF